MGRVEVFRGFAASLFPNKRVFHLLVLPRPTLSYFLPVLPVGRVKFQRFCGIPVPKLTPVSLPRLTSSYTVLLPPTPTLGLRQGEVVCSSREGGVLALNGVVFPMAVGADLVVARAFDDAASAAGTMVESLRMLLHCCFSQYCLPRSGRKKVFG